MLCTHGVVHGFTFRQYAKIGTYLTVLTMNDVLVSFLITVTVMITDRLSDRSRVYFDH